MSANLLDEVKEHRKDIKYDTLTFSLMELVNMHAAKPSEIIIQPDFQRLFRWSRRQQTDFIESLILEIPIPPIFFYENDDGRWELLDGLQRFSTILRFFCATEIPAEYRGVAANDEEWHYDHQNDLDVPLQLLAGDYLTGLEGFSFNTLPVQLQLNLKRARLHIYVLKRETHKMYKYEVFKRLNRGGTPAEDQEIRNCSIRLIAEEFPTFLRDIAADANFVSAVGRSEEDQRRGYVEELCVRFFAFKNNAAKFRHDVSQFLTEYMEEVAKGTLKFDYTAERTLFQDTWRKINEALPDGEAFRGRSDRNHAAGPFSPAMFDMVSIGIAQNIDRVRNLAPDILKGKIVDLLLTAPTTGFTGSGSNSRRKTQGRLEYGIHFFRN